MNFATHAEELGANHPDLVIGTSSGPPTGQLALVGVAWHCGMRSRLQAGIL